MIKVDKNNLPENWVLTTIGEIALNITDGSHNPPRKINAGIPMLSARNIQNGTITFDEVRYISVNEFLNENNRTKLEQGDVLLTIVGTIGRTAIIKDFKQKFTLQRSVAVIKPKIPSKYLVYAIQSPDFQKQLVDNSKGTAQKGIYLKTLNSLIIPIPPLTEQHRIVEKIEELFSELDKAQESLLNAQKQIKIYRQVVLKDAFNENKRNIKQEPQIHKWDTKILGEIISVASGKGLTSSQRVNNGLYSVYGGNGKMGNHNKFMFLERKIIIGRVGSYCGNVHITETKSWVTDNAFVVEFDKEIIDFYFLKYLLEQLNLNKYSSSTTLPVISGSKIYPIIIKVPKINEQQQIVQEIEYRFTHIENLEKSITENLKRIEIFKQVILQKAFSGNLVSQNENDEPASELLKQIKEEIRVYQIHQKEIAKNKPQKLVFMESNKTVKEILEEANGKPMDAKEVWQKSIHKDDIEKFYEELKQLSESIEVSFEGITSKLLLKK
jgi:type I restriction enzyme S subunit